MNDPMDARIGAECDACGDDASVVYDIATGSRLKQTAFCDHCADVEVAECVECGLKVWRKTSTRIGTEEFCEDCAAHHPAVVSAVMAALNADEFNERRR